MGGGTGPDVIRRWGKEVKQEKYIIYLGIMIAYLQADNVINFVNSTCSHLTFAECLLKMDRILLTTTRISSVISLMAEQFTNLSSLRNSNPTLWAFSISMETGTILYTSMTQLAFHQQV